MTAATPSASAREFQAPEAVSRLQRRAGLVGFFGLLIAAYGWVKSPEHFYVAYLMSYMLVLGFALGSLGLVMLQHLTSGFWGIVIRRPAEAATRTLPLLAVLFFPIGIGGLKYLYAQWTDPEQVRKQPLSEFQQGYLTVHGFWIRALIYFAVWLTLMAVFNAWSRRQDVDREDRLLRRRMKMLAGPGIILYVFGISFAAIDWVMSINPHWASTIYGFLYVAGQLISSMALMIITVILLARTESFAHVVKTRYIHDLSKLLFAFLLLWAYFDFSQLLIIWSGNQPEEISFYLARYYGFWGAISIVIVIFHFFVPFFLLLSQSLKRTPRLMIYVAGWLILMRVVDLMWLTHPDLPQAQHWRIAPLDIVLPIALTAIWLAFYAWQLKREPLLPLGEPKLPEVLASHEH
jgi:hypothetical protein